MERSSSEVEIFHQIFSVLNTLAFIALEKESAARVTSDQDEEGRINKQEISISYSSAYT